MAVVGIVAYIISFFVAMWASYWWFVGFVLLSPFVATFIAAREYEYWPVVHPQYGFFWTFPAIFAVLQLVFNHPREWGQWLGWSLGVAVVITAIWTLTLRRYIVASGRCSARSVRSLCLLLTGSMWQTPVLAGSHTSPSWRQSSLPTPADIVGRRV